MSCVTTMLVTPMRCLQRTDQAVDDVRHDRIEPRRGLVVENVRGIHGDRPRQRRRACACRPRARRASISSTPCSPTHSSRSAHAARGSRPRSMRRVLAQRQRDVLAHGQRVEQRPALEQHAEALAHARAARAPCRPTTSSPSTSMVPASGCMSPMMCLSRTLLPVPLRPSTTTVRPVGMSRSTPSSTLLERPAACAARGWRS